MSIGSAPTALMRFYGAPHEVDISAIRRRMVQLDAKRVRDYIEINPDAKPGSFPRSRGYRGWAEHLGVCHMTLRRLLEAKPISLDSFNLILFGLGLEFNAIAVPQLDAA